MKIYKYYPNCFDRGDLEPDSGEFENFDELCEIDFVKNFIEREEFYGLSYNSGSLMAEYKGGYEWSLIGHLLPYSNILHLPEWRAKYTEEQIKEKEKKEKIRSSMIIKDNYKTKILSRLQFDFSDEKDFLVSLKINKNFYVSYYEYSISIEEIINDFVRYILNDTIMWEEK